MNLQVTEFRVERPSFGRSYKALPADIQQAVKDALELLKTNPESIKLRLKRLKGYKNPNVYAVHLKANHSYKLTFEMQGTTAVLRRVGTHKQIDRCP